MCVGADTVVGFVAREQPDVQLVQYTHYERDDAPELGRDGAVVRLLVAAVSAPLMSLPRTIHLFLRLQSKYTCFTYIHARPTLVYSRSAVALSLRTYAPPSVGS